LVAEVGESVGDGCFASATSATSAGGATGDRFPGTVVKVIQNVRPRGRVDPRDSDIDGCGGGKCRADSGFHFALADGIRGGHGDAVELGLKGNGGQRRVDGQIQRLDAWGLAVDLDGGGVWHRGHGGEIAVGGAAGAAKGVIGHLFESGGDSERGGHGDIDPAGRVVAEWDGVGRDGAAVADIFREVGSVANHWRQPTHLGRKGGLNKREG
jgi:hypothetical protein